MGERLVLSGDMLSEVLVDMLTGGGEGGGMSL